MVAVLVGCRVAAWAPQRDAPSSGTLTARRCYFGGERGRGSGPLHFSASERLSLHGSREISQSAEDNPCHGAPHGSLSPGRPRFYSNPGTYTGSRGSGAHDKGSRKVGEDCSRLTLTGALSIPEACEEERSSSSRLAIVSALSHFLPPLAR